MFWKRNKSAVTEFRIIKVSPVPAATCAVSPNTSIKVGIAKNAPPTPNNPAMNPISEPAKGSTQVLLFFTVKSFWKDRQIMLVAEARRITPNPINKALSLMVLES